MTDASPSRADFGLVHRLRVRWAEIDRQGIVFNGHYLAYFDIGITEYWRAIGYPYPDALLSVGSDMFVVKATVEYHAPAHYDDLIDVMVRVGRIGRTSILFLIELTRTEPDDAVTHLVSGEVIYVNADALSRKPAPVPEFLRAAIDRFEPRRPSA